MKSYLSITVILATLLCAGCCGGSSGCNDCVVDTTTSGCCGSSNW